LADGTTWIGVFVNRDPRHDDFGRRAAFPYDMQEFDRATVDETCAPDRPEIGPGFRYRLVAKCVMVQEALAAMVITKAPNPLPKRFILPAGVPSGGQLLNLYRALTGKEPTPQDRAELVRILSEPPPSVTSSPSKSGA
jgi:hypothetical protein